MARFNIDSLRSYALAGFASLYATVLLLALAGQNGVMTGPFIA